MPLEIASGETPLVSETKRQWVTHFAINTYDVMSYKLIFNSN